MIKRPDPYLSDIACQRRLEKAGERATELEIPKPNHLTKCELAVRDEPCNASKARMSMSGAKIWA